MNFHATASLILSVSSFLLGVFVYLKGRNKLQNITYALITLGITIWCFGQFMGEISPDKSLALLWTRINLAGGILVIAFFVNFVAAFLNELPRKKWIVISAYLVSCVFLILDATPLFVSDVEPILIFRFYPVPGPTYPFFTVFFFLAVGWGLLRLAAALRTEKGVFRNQIIYVFLSSVIAFAGASTLFFPVFGINIYPIGYYFVPLYIFLGVYAIVKHRLLDITVVIRRGLVYSIMALLLSVLYVGSIYLFGEIFKTVTGFRSIIPTVLVLFVFAAAFNPLREYLQTQVDRIFFRGKYDFRQTMKEISNATSLILDLDELLEKVLGKLVSTVGAEGGSVFLKDDAGGFKLAKAVGRRGGVDAASAERAVIPLLIKGERIGFIELERKISEDIYTDEDISLLSTLANNLAVAVENALLHEEMVEKERQLFHADKLASLGTLSAGMAHEIKNPLAIIKGMSQSISENLQNREYLEKFSEVIPRQIDRIDGLVEDMMAYSRPGNIRKEETDVNSVLKDSMKFIGEECRKRGISLEHNLDDSVPGIMADRELLTQAFLNLMLNAIQAMPNGGELTVTSLPAGEAGNQFTEGGRERVCVEISDTGRGISKENLARIFDPFFTTKEKGTGLGLAVTYRIVKEHGGEIEVASEVGKGTRFKVIL